MTTRLIAATVVLFVACSAPPDRIAARAQSSPLPTGTLDELLAPIALYPDPLLAQMLMSAGDPAKITELNTWLKGNQKLQVEHEVYVHADQELPYGSVVKVMAALSRNGGEKIGLVTDPLKNQ